MAASRTARRSGPRLGVVLALAAVTVLVPTAASATVTTTRAEVGDGRLRIEGRALANRAITVDGVAMTTSDGSGTFRISRSPYTPPADCTVDVHDGSATPTTVRLSGCTVTATEPPPATTPALLPDAPELAQGYVGEEYGSTSNIVTLGPGAVGPVSWDVVAGALPAGLSVVVPVPAGRPSPGDPTYMTISGVPTTAGSSTFTLRATDAEGRTATRTYTIRINPPRPLTLTPQSANPLRVGVSANLWYDAAGGVRPYGWAITAGAVPPGMALVDDTAGDALVRVGGTPTTAGTYTWTLRLTDAQGVSTERTVTATVDAAAVLTGVTVAPARVTGGASATGTVTLDLPAPPEAAEVGLASSHPAVASVPTRAFVLAAATSGTFPVSTTAVATTTVVTLSATYRGVTRTTTLTVEPAAGSAPVAVQGLTLSPTSVTGGGASTATVRLAAAAPAGGQVVAVSTGAGPAGAPSGVTVPAGATTASFTVTTTAVTATTTVTVTASAGSGSASAALTITPPATTTPTLSAPALLSPANDARWAPGALRTFDWGDVAGATGYTLQVSTSSAFTTVELSRSVTASDVALTFTSEATRYWRVRAHGEGGAAGPWSATRSFRVRS